MACGLFVVVKYAIIFLFVSNRNLIFFFFAQDPYMDEDDLALVVSIYFSNSNPYIYFDCNKIRFTNTI